MKENISNKGYNSVGVYNGEVENGGDDWEEGFMNVKLVIVLSYDG